MKRKHLIARIEEIEIGRHLFYLEKAESILYERCSETHPGCAAIGDCPSIKAKAADCANQAMNYLARSN